MPPSRRQAASTRRSGGQSTLSFGSHARVTKPPTTGHASTKKGKDTAATVTDILRTTTPTSVSTSPRPTSPAEAEVAKPQAAGSSRSENVVRQQVTVEIRQSKCEEDRRAEALTGAEIRRYWEKEEEKRRAPRVHQEGLSVHEKILRHFDISSQYGPCIGIARIKRWKRANMLGLHPPIEVLAVLLQDEAKGAANEKAYMDELLS